MGSKWNRTGNDLLGIKWKIDGKKKTGLKLGLKWF